MNHIIQRMIYMIYVGKYYIHTYIDIHNVYTNIIHDIWISTIINICIALKVVIYEQF